MNPLSFAIGLLVCLFASTAYAEIRAERVFPADGKKTLSYVKDGLIVGGDQAIDSVIIKDIRRASNSGFERVVIDLEPSRKGQAVGVPRPPYFQVAVNSEEKRLLVSIWGSPRFEFDSKKVLASFKKSSLVQSVQLLPRVDEDHWTFSLDLKGITPIEVFDLSSPARIIIDLKSKS